jgi:hypothetical protein
MFPKPAYTLLLFILIPLSLAAQDIYVSPSGDDTHDGSRGFPLKTLPAAQGKALEILTNGRDAEVTVWLGGGIYSIVEPLEFRPFAAGNLYFKAQEGETPIISGGVQLLGWEKNEEGLWEAPIPKTLVGHSVRELFIEGQRAPRARFPNDGFLHIKKAGEDRRTNFYFEKGDFPVPHAPEDVELVFLHDWSISRVKVRDIDAAEGRLYTADTIGAKSPEFFTIDNWEPNPRYFLENAIEFIDTDLEWVFLKDQDKVVLQLPTNADPNQLEIVIPASSGLISIIGSERELVKNIHFEGISFQYSRWEIPVNGYCGVQACHFDPRTPDEKWAVVPAAVSTVWAEDISFVDCSFRNFGGSGIWIGEGSRNCRIVDSELWDISGNGIMIGEGTDRIVQGKPWWESAPEQVAFSNTVENCTISQVGAQYFGAVGIWGGLVANTTIKNNELFDLPYSGISVGWMWSPVPTPSRENIIEGNHIHEIMNILSDGGGIYMLGLQPGSKILNNRIHGVKVNAGRAESNGMFLDEGTTDVLVEENVIYDIAKSPLRFHRATTNLVKGNYFFTQDGNPAIRYNTTRESDIDKVGNFAFSVGDPTYDKELEIAISRWGKKQGQSKTIKSKGRKLR